MTSFLERDFGEFTNLAAKRGFVRHLEADSLALGDSAVGDANIVIYKEGSVTRAADGTGVLSEDSDSGAVFGDVFNTHAGEGDTVLIAPNDYDTSSLSKIVTPAKNMTISGYGATVNSTVRVEQWPVDVLGLNVDGATGNGFEWFRAQGGTYADLRADNCTEVGFMLGGEENAQIGYGFWTGCNAKTNSGRGWVLDGSNTNSWANANVVTGGVSRHNGDGQTTDHGLEIQGVANYNTFIGMQIESNDGDYAAVVNGDENTFVGGHYVENVASMHFPGAGTANAIQGGRYPQGIVDDTTNGTGWFGFVGGSDTQSKVWMDNVGGATATDVDRGNIIFDPTNGRLVWKDGNGNAYYVGGTAL